MLRLALIRPFLSEEIAFRTRTNWFSPARFLKTFFFFELVLWFGLSNFFEPYKQLLYQL